MAFARIVEDPASHVKYAEAPPFSGWRYRGATRPLTTGWTEGDAWLDTSDPATDGNVVRLWTGATFSPEESGAPGGGTLLLSDTFTGTDGTVWDATKWTTGRNSLVSSPVSAGGATLLSNVGVLAASSSLVDYDGNSTVSRRAIITDTADVNILLSFKFDATTSFFGIHARHSTTTLDRKDGYWLQLAKETNKWSVGELDGSYANTLLGTEQDFTYAADTWYKARFYCVGTAIKAKVWTATSAEPGTWGVQVTDSTYTSAGKTGLSVSGGIASTLPRRVFVDDVTIRAS